MFCNLSAQCFATIYICVYIFQHVSALPCASSSEYIYICIYIIYIYWGQHPPPVGSSSPPLGGGYHNLTAWKYRWCEHGHTNSSNTPNPATTPTTLAAYGKVPCVHICSTYYISNKWNDKENLILRRRPPLWEIIVSLTIEGLTIASKKSNVWI